MGSPALGGKSGYLFSFKKTSSPSQKKMSMGRRFEKKYICLPGVYFPNLRGKHITRLQLRAK